MGRAKQVKNIDKFQNAIGYLIEYSGVKGAVIADFEGLVLAGGGINGFEPEKYAAYSLEIINAVQGPLQKLLRPEVDHLGIKTPRDWLTIAVAHPLMLVVAADRRADDLLHIRIARSLEMISSKLKEKYSLAPSADNTKAKNAKSLEAINV
jgi:predicted regulator of Ras-like GTPase activity (Roadblock/LC7/MglB family)